MRSGRLDGSLESHIGLVYQLGETSDGLPIVQRVTQTLGAAGMLDRSHREELDVDEWSYVDSPARVPGRVLPERPRRGPPLPRLKEPAVQTTLTCIFAPSGRSRIRSWNEPIQP